MLEAASLRFYVGDPNGRVPNGVRLVPDGDVEEIARAVAAAWEPGG
jgi:hypothetical protein